MSPHTVSSIKAEIIVFFFFFSCAGSPLLLLSLSLAVASSGIQTQALGKQASVVWCMGAVVEARGLNCSMACEIFPDQGSNLCPLH